MEKKSTVAEIRARFDQDVERFSSLETGQSATLDASLALELAAKAAARAVPGAHKLLDIGCGAGNYSLKMLEFLPELEITLIDLSEPMLRKAVERIEAVSRQKITPIQGDIRQVDLPAAEFDVIEAAAVLHHLREESEWAAVFASLHRALKPGGCLWIFDLVEHSVPGVQQLMWERYGEYLARLKDEAYREHVFRYIEREDTPRPLLFQIDLLRRSGFSTVEILHKNGCFALFGAVK